MSVGRPSPCWDFAILLEQKDSVCYSTFTEFTIVDFGKCFTIDFRILKWQALELVLFFRLTFQGLQGLSVSCLKATRTAKLVGPSVSRRSARRRIITSWRKPLGIALAVAMQRFLQSSLLQRFFPFPIHLSNSFATLQLFITSANKWHCGLWHRRSKGFPNGPGHWIPAL